LKRLFRYINPILALALLSMVLHVGMYHAHDVLGQVQHEHLSDQSANHASDDDSGHNHDHSKSQSEPVQADATHCVAGLIHLSTGDIIQPLSSDIVVVEYLFSSQDLYNLDPTGLGFLGRAPPVATI